MTTVMDPVQQLRVIEEIAREAQRQLQAGGAKTGHAALRKIEEIAQDTQRWTKEAA